MAVGAKITEADPAIIRTGIMRTEVAGGIDQAVAPSSHYYARLRRSGGLRMRPASLLKRLAIGLASETCERFVITF
jgi:hypothetical protein